jgi:hypothetical protein
MTAGYSNGGLYYDAQQNSYANILAEQFKLIGGGEFKIPNVSQSSIGMGNANNAPSILGNRTDCKGAGVFRSCKNCYTRRCFCFYKHILVKAHLIIWRCLM